VTTLRGEIWTVSGGVYASKPRPAVILQSNAFPETASVTLAPSTSDQTDAPLIRLLLLPDARNGLREPSRFMIDKVTTVSRSKPGSRIGGLPDEEMVRFTRAAAVFLGIA
jgi:mRNA interferase MazF